MSTHPLDIDGIAHQFYETFQRTALESSDVPWDELDEIDKEPLRKVVQDLLDRDVIVPGNHVAVGRFLG